MRTTYAVTVMNKTEDEIDYERDRENHMRKLILYFIGGEFGIQLLFIILALSFKWTAILWGLLFVAGVGLGVFAVLLLMVSFISKLLLISEYTIVELENFTQILGAELSDDEPEDSENKSSKQ